MTRRILITFAVVSLTLPLAMWSAGDDNPTPVPMMRNCDPGQGRAGDLISVTGENLGKNRVAELFLTKGAEDIKVVIVDQSNSTMKFKVPAEASEGRYMLTVLTTTVVPQLIEQPVLFNVTK